MAKQRTLADGSRVVLTDMKITRRLDALTKLAANHVVEGCMVTTTALADTVALSAGVIVMNNQLKTVAAATYSVGTRIGNPYTTLYIPSTGNTVASVMVLTTPTGALWCPDTNPQSGSYTIPKESMLIAHINRSIATETVLTAAQINNNVRPSLFFDAGAWSKDNGTDTDNTIVNSER